MLLLVKALGIGLIVILSIAFITLFERKLISFRQSRTGPVKSFYLGLLQSMSDFMKLFGKTLWPKSTPTSKPLFVVFLPIVSLLVYLFSWSALPIWCNNNPNIGALFFLLCLSLNRYPVVLYSWYTNNKYRFLARFRLLGQMISYELCLSVIILSILFLHKNSYFFIIYQFIIIPLHLIVLWMLAITIELNRSPFDFRESEREIVAGFITEYGGTYLRYFFLSEYGMIILFRVLTRIMFNKTEKIFVFWGFIILWFRIVIPRTRYDKQIITSWKYFLPPLIFIIFARYLSIF